MDKEKRDKILRDEIRAVKELGENLGYGHLMSIASSLWTEALKEKGYPTEGVFVPTCLSFIKERHREMTIRKSEHYGLILRNSKIDEI